MRHKLSSRVVLARQPCPFSGCGSSDGYHVYDDGHGHCFSCDRTLQPSAKGGSTIDELYDVSQSQSKPDKHEGHYLLKDYPGSSQEYAPWRGISKDTMAFYQVATKVLPDGKPLCVGFKYPGGGFKLRAIDEKDFISKGSMSAPGLFGQDKFPAGSSKSIVITEGELDALSVYEMLGNGTPAVSVRGGSSARKDCQQVFEYLNSFDKIYLCLDNDEVGRKAAQQVASLFDFNKVYSIALGPYKDANEYLTNGKGKEFRGIFFNARRYLPEGIISSPDDFSKILDDDGERPSVPYPFDTLQEKSMGIRTGEFVLVTAPEGIGKTEFIRRIEHHLLVSTTAPIGCIHLEETKARQLKGLAGIELRAPVHLPDAGVSVDEIKATLVKLTDGRDDRLHIYSHFGSDDPDVLLEAIRFLVVVCGCRYVFLDHITMVVSGLETEDERRTLDYLSTKLATMCHDLDFTLFCISHVNDDGKTRGSRNISKVANLRIDLSRNLVAELEEDRNKTYLTVSKNRYAGKTGPAGVLAFDVDEFMLKEAHEVYPMVPTE